MAYKRQPLQTCRRTPADGSGGCRFATECQRVCFFLFCWCFVKWLRGCSSTLIDKNGRHHSEVLWGNDGTWLSWRYFAAVALLESSRCSAAQISIMLLRISASFLAGGSRHECSPQEPQNMTYTCDMYCDRSPSDFTCWSSKLQTG